MIVRLNGTHGSGKSTTVTKLMKLYGATPSYADGDAKFKRPIGYKVELPTGMLWVVGPYEIACGGCDSIQPFANIWPRVMMGVQNNWHVLFEGALLSTVYGSVGREMELLDAAQVSWAFMDTPLAMCQARVNERRATRGAGPLTDFKNVDSKWYTVNRLKDKLAAGSIGSIGAHRTVWIDHKQPVKTVLKEFGVTIRKEPS